MMWPFNKQHDILNLRNKSKSLDLDAKISDIKKVVNSLNSVQKQNFSKKCIEANKSSGVYASSTYSTGLDGEQHTACYNLTQIGIKDGLDVKSPEFEQFALNSVDSLTDSYLTSSYNFIKNNLQKGWSKYGVTTDGLEKTKQAKINLVSENLSKTFKDNPKDTESVKAQYQKNTDYLASFLQQEATKLKSGKSDVFNSASKINSYIHESVNTTCDDLNKSKLTENICGDARKKVFEQPSLLQYSYNTLFALVSSMLFFYAGYKILKYGYNCFRNPERDWSVYNPWTNLKSFCSHPIQSTKDQLGNLKDFVKESCISTKDYVNKGYEYVKGDDKVKQFEKNKENKKEITQDQDKEQKSVHYAEIDHSKQGLNKDLNSDNAVDNKDVNSQDNSDSQTNQQEQKTPEKPKTPRAGISIEEYSDDLVEELDTSTKAYIQDIQKNNKTWVDVFEGCSMNNAEGFTKVIDKFKKDNIAKVQQIIEAERLSLGAGGIGRNAASDNTNNTDNAQQAQKDNSDQKDT